MLCGLDWNALPARVSTGWIFSVQRVKISVVASTDQGQISCWVDLNIQSIAAGLSQCLIVNILNDVMWSGLECFVSKGLNGLDFQCGEGEKFSCGPQLYEAESVSVQSFSSKP